VTAGSTDSSPFATADVFLLGGGLGASFAAPTAMP
jgi:hypothetical protein